MPRSTELYPDPLRMVIDHHLRADQILYEDVGQVLVWNANYTASANVLATLSFRSEPKTTTPSSRSPDRAFSTSLG